MVCGCEKFFPAVAQQQQARPGSCCLTKFTFLFCHLCITGRRAAPLASLSTPSVAVDNMKEERIPRSYHTLIIILHATPATPRGPATDDDDDTGGGRDGRATLFQGFSAFYGRRAAPAALELQCSPLIILVRTQEPAVLSLLPCLCPAVLALP